MPRYAYERLSAQDNLFLVAESASTPMHIGAVQIIESGPMCSSDGGIDVARFARGLAAQPTAFRATGRSSARRASARVRSGSTIRTSISAGTCATRAFRGPGASSSSSSSRLG